MHTRAHGVAEGGRAPPATAPRQCSPVRHPPSIAVRKSGERPQYCPAPKPSDWGHLDNRLIKGLCSTCYRPHDERPAHFRRLLEEQTVPIAHSLWQSGVECKTKAKTICCSAYGPPPMDPYIHCFWGLMAGADGHRRSKGSKPVRTAPAPRDLIRYLLGPQLRACAGAVTCGCCCPESG